MTSVMGGWQGAIGLAAGCWLVQLPPRGFRFKGRHGGDRGVDPFLFGHAFLDSCRDDAGAKRLVKSRRSPGFAPSLANVLGMNDAGDGVSECCFFVANAVAADDGASGFHHFGKAACAIRSRIAGSAFGKANQGEREAGRPPMA